MKGRIPRRSRGPRRALVMLVAGLALLGAQWLREGRLRVGDFVLWPREPRPTEQSALPEATGSSVVERLFDERRSDVVVRVEGVVERVLLDDLQGSRHQRFILKLPSGHTVLVAHNLDLAARVPLARGDRVEVQGEYEWTERGGVLHWTHRDPRGRREGGWIRLRGESYR